MGFLRRKKERATPEPGTPEFDQAVQGSALPDSQSVSMGEPGWTDPGKDAEQPAQTEEERAKPKRRERIIRGMATRVPNQGGFGAGIPGPKRKPKR